MAQKTDIIIFHYFRVLLIFTTTTNRYTDSTQVNIIQLSDRRIPMLFLYCVINILIMVCIKMHFSLFKSLPITKKSYW